jgi:hypothetical protein
MFVLIDVSDNRFLAKGLEEILNGAQLSFVGFERPQVQIVQEQTEGEIER